MSSEHSSSSLIIHESVILTLANNHLQLSCSNVKKKDRIKVRRELSLSLQADQRKLIHRNELPFKVLTREHIASLLGASSLQSNDIEGLISSKLHSVSETKKDVRAYAGMHIRHQMLEMAVDRKMLLKRSVVNSFRQLMQSWKHEQPTPQQCESIFHITYGWFDANRSWNYDMETKYLHLRNIMYIDEAADDFENLDSNLKMGCIARLCADVKNDIVWQIRKVGVLSHGVKVNITRPGASIDEGDRYRKRIKGAEFNIIRTKDGATGVGDVGSVIPSSSEDDDSSNDLPHQEGNDEVEPQGEEPQELEEPQGDEPQNEEPQELLEPQEQEEPHAQRDNAEVVEPHSQQGNAEDEPQELEDPRGAEQSTAEDEPAQELEEPHAEQESNAEDELAQELEEPHAEQGNTDEEPQELEDFISILVTNTPDDAGAGVYTPDPDMFSPRTFVCTSTGLDHLTSIDDLVKETNPYYCQSGFYLSGRRCARCEIGFVYLSTNDNALEIRPSVRTPGWVCLHAQKKASTSGDGDKNEESDACTFVLCPGCFQLQVLCSSPPSKKKSKRTRRRPNRRMSSP